MAYITNPKMAGSGLLACIPQKGRCPNNCKDCFFQSGRSYLEPLDENLPNMPSIKEAKTRIVRVNDGNDSNNDANLCILATEAYPFKFYNTSKVGSFSKFDAPVVLTINPGEMTDNGFYKLRAIPENLMFMRFRTNTWNLELLDKAVDFYTKQNRLSARNVPIVLTFMAYYGDEQVDNVNIPTIKRSDYIYRKRTSNNYWAITTHAWDYVMSLYRHNKWVYSCGKIEGEQGDTHCARCGNCVREYFVTMERMRVK